MAEVIVYLDGVERYRRYFETLDEAQDYADRNQEPGYEYIVME